MADPTQQMQQMLNTVEAGFGGANTAAQQLASALLQAAKSGSTQANAAEASAKALAAVAARSESVRAGLSNVGGAFVGLINQSTMLTAGMYGADKAFSSVIPTLDVLSSTMTKIIAGFGQLGAGVSILGFSFGQASVAAASFVNSGIDAITNILKFQIEASQKVADSYTSAVRAGALFGGSIERLGKSAASLFVPMQTLVKVITANVESLSKLGLGQERAGLLVAGMAKQVFNSSESLRVMYGGFDELAVGVAQYLELQSQLGINVQNDYRITKDAAIEYLFRQRELSAITGKNTELLKKEEQGRRTQLDYNLKLGRLGEVAKANVSEGMALSGKIFGDLGAKYAQEYFATGGKVISKEMLTFAATNEEAASAIAHLMSNVDQSAATFRSGNAAYLQANAPALEAYARSLESMAELNRAANNPILRAQTETGAAILENMTLLKDLTGQYAILEADRIRRLKEPLDAPTKAVADAQMTMMQNQLEIDKIVIKNMEGMGNIINMLNQVQRGFISMQGEASAALNEMIKTGFGGATEINKFIESLMKKMSDLPAPPVAPPVPAAPPAAPPVAPPVPAPSMAPPAVPLPPESSGPTPTPAENPVASASETEDARTRQVALETQIENLTRAILAMTTPTNTQPADAAQTVMLASMLAELREHSDLLNRIRNGLA